MRGTSFLAVACFLLALSASPVAAQGCNAFGPAAAKGVGGSVTAQPIYSVSGSCPTTDCQFLFRLTVLIGPVPGSTPPMLPVPEPPIFIGVSLNGTPVVVTQITTPPAGYGWQQDIQGPLPCGNAASAVFSYIPVGGVNPVHIGTVNWTCSGCD